MLQSFKSIVSVMISLIIVLNSSLLVFAQEAEGPVQPESTASESSTAEAPPEQSPEEKLQSLLNDTHQFDAQNTGEEELPAIQNPAAKQEAKTFSLENLEQPFVNILSGASEFQIPITVPNGINGLTPQLQLSYSSQMVNTNGPFGYGWEMQLGHIKKINKNGVDLMYQQPIYQLSLPGISGEIIQTSSDAVSKSYELRREGAFAKITYDKTNKNWTVQSKDGMTYHLGTSNQSRWMDETGEMTYAWYLEKVEDLHGNHIDYEYHSQHNILYPKAIHYGARGNGTHPFSISFFPFNDPTQNLNNILLNRNDYQEFDYKKGFKSTYSALINEIQIMVQGNERMKYELLYTYSNHLGRSDLKTVSISGTNGSEVTTQDITMSYYTPEDGYAGKMYHRHGFLRKIDFFQGGSVEYDYLPTNQFYTSFNRIANPRPHYPMYAVNELKKTDFTGREDTWTYFYSDGAFFADSVEDRQMSGFGRVTVTDPLDQKIIYYFHQGGGFDGSSLGENAEDDDDSAEGRWALIGQLYRSEVYDAAGNMIQRSITSWEKTKLQTNQFFVSPSAEISTRFNTSGQSRSTASTTSYDITTGNMTEQHLLGEVSASNNGDYTDIGNDDRKVKMSYALNTTKHLLSFPKSQELYDENGTLISKQEMEYDNLPLGQVDKGNLTKQSAINLSINSAASARVKQKLSTINQYNTVGLPTSTTDPNGTTTTISYDPTGIYPATITNPLGHQTTFVYDLLFSQPIRVTDPNGLIAETDLDGLGRPIASRLSDPNNSNSLATMQSIEYFETSFPHAVKTTTHLDSNQSAEAFAYLDGFGRTLQTKTQADPDGSGTAKYSVTNTTYDELGRATIQTLPVFSSTSAYNLNDGSPITTTTTYDVLGRPLSITDTNGTTTFSHDTFPSAIASAAQQSLLQNAGSTSLTGAIWTQSITDANGNFKILAYDAFQRLSKVIELTSQSPQGPYSPQGTHYSYDSRDLLSSLTDAEGNTRNFFYDSLGRLTLQEDLHAPNDTDFGSYSYTYDNNGNVLTSINPKGESILFTYDALNRPLTQASATESYSYTYDSPGSFGRLAAVSSSSSRSYRSSLSYDLRGRLISETNTIDSANFTKTTTYTRFDQPSTITYPDGTTITFSYNAVGQIKQIQSGADDIITSAEYNPINQVTKMVYGNGITSTMTYDPQQMYRMTSKLTRKGTVVMNEPGWMGWLAWLRSSSDPLSPLKKGTPSIAQHPFSVILLSALRLKLEESETKNPGDEKSTLDKFFSSLDWITPAHASSDAVILSGAKNLGLDYHTVEKDSSILQNDSVVASNTNHQLSTTNQQPLFLASLKSRIKKRIQSRPQGPPSPQGTHSPQDSLPPTPVIPNPKLEQLINDKTQEATAAPVQQNALLRQLLNDRGFGSNDPIIDPTSGQLTMPSTQQTPAQAPSLPIGTNGKSEITFQGDANGDSTSDVNGIVFLSATYSNNDPSAEQATGFQLVINKNGQMVWQDNGYQTLPQALSVGETTPTLSYDLSALGNTVSGSLDQYSFQFRFQLSSGFVTPPSDPVMFTLDPNHVPSDPIGSTAPGTPPDPNNPPPPPTPAPPPVAPTGDIFQDLSYSYDAVGNITRLEERADVPGKKVSAFIYDSLHRLTRASITNATAAYPDYTETYTYDAIGNILNKSDQGDYSYAQPGKVNPQAVTKIESSASSGSPASSASFLYDDNGNLTRHTQTSAQGDITKSYIWDAYNRMTKSTVVNPDGSTLSTTYDYDHSGRRIRKQNEYTAPGASFGTVSTTLYPFGDFEVTDLGNTKTSVLGNSMHVATVEYIQGSREIYFSHTDHLGGGNIITDDQGIFIQTLDYKPFGGTRVNEKYTEFDERRKYTGHELDDETGLYYAQARYYNPDIGRFVSQDPLQWRVGELMEKFAEQPQAHNFYSYVGNNPIIKIDPKGEFEYGFGGLFRMDKRTNGAISRDIQRNVQQFKDASKAVAATAASSAALYLGATNPQAVGAALSKPETVGALMNTAERAYYDYNDDGKFNDPLSSYGGSAALGVAEGKILKKVGVIGSAIGSGIAESIESGYIDGNVDPVSSAGNAFGAGLSKAIFKGPIGGLVKSQINPSYLELAEGATGLFTTITSTEMLNKYSNDNPEN